MSDTPAERHDELVKPRLRRTRPSQTGPILSAVVIVLAGFSVALVEAYRFPKGSVWGVVAVAVALILVIRLLTRRRD
jgi:hypothetical protein